MQPFRMALFVLLVAILAVATVQSGPATQDETIPIIDVHTHTSFTGDTQEQYFKEWREAGIVGAVAHTTASGQGFHDLKSRSFIDIERAKRLESGTFSGFTLSVGPRNL